MKKSSFFLTSLFLLPLVTHAQSLQTFITNFVTFLSGVVIPFLLGIGFLFFVINAVRYFIIGSTTIMGEGDKKKTVTGDRGKAKALAIYSVFAFVIIVIFWGFVNMLTSSTGLQGKIQPDQDYVKMKGG